MSENVLWIEKIESLIGKKLVGSYMQRTDIDWKGTYDYLVIGISSGNPFWTPPHRSQALFEVLLEIGLDPFTDDRAIRNACNYDNIEVVRLLLSDPRASLALKGSFIIEQVSCTEQLDLLQLLLEHGVASPTTHDNKALRFARYKGHIRVEKILLSDSRVRSHIWIEA
jgi:hypothetical protein